MTILLILLHFSFKRAQIKKKCFYFYCLFWINYLLIIKKNNLLFIKYVFIISIIFVKNALGDYSSLTYYYYFF